MIDNNHDKARKSALIRNLRASLLVELNHVNRLY